MDWKGSSGDSPISTLAESKSLSPSGPAVTVLPRWSRKVNAYKSALSEKTFDWSLSSSSHNNGSPDTMVGVQNPRVRRRAKDGYVATDCRTGVVDHGTEQ